MQNDVCALFDTKGLFSHQSAEGGKLLCDLFRFQFKTKEEDFVT